MKSLFKCSLCIIPFALLASYETVSISGSNGEQHDVVMKKLDVPTILEVRDYESVFKRISITNFQDDVIVKKLLPKQVLSDSNSVHVTELSPYDTEDIVLDKSELNLDIKRMTSDTMSLCSNNTIFHEEISGGGFCTRSYDINYNAYDSMPVFNFARSKFAHIDIRSLDMKIFNASYSINDEPVHVINPTHLDVIVNQSVFDYLARRRDETRFSRRYTKYSYEQSPYLRDLDALNEYDRWQWIKILKAHKTCSIKHVKARTKRKIAAELRYAPDAPISILDANLEFLSSCGYDAILVRFDTSENLESLVKIVNIIKKRGFQIYITYVGLDNQTPVWNPFCSRYALEFFFQALAPLSEGLFLNWRSTSAHVKLLPIELFNYLCSIARSYNENILIYGEIFYGNISYLREMKTVVTCPENVTGVLINNMGYVGYNHAYIVNKLFANSIQGYFKLDKICQVIGYAPYYCSKHDLGLSIDEEYSHKSEVENKFRRINCSTVSFIHDGVDDNYVINKTYDTDDNILTDSKISTHNTTKERQNIK